MRNRELELELEINGFCHPDPDHSRTATNAATTQRDSDAPLSPPLSQSNSRRTKGYQHSVASINTMRALPPDALMSFYSSHPRLNQRTREKKQGRRGSYVEHRLISLASLCAQFIPSSVCQTSGTETFPVTPRAHDCGLFESSFPLGFVT